MVRALQHRQVWLIANPLLLRRLLATTIEDWDSAKSSQSTMPLITLPSSMSGSAHKKYPRLTPGSIIAIHGLGTASPRTWEFKKKDGGIVNWLADGHMLPAAIPEARIFTYDWNANYFKDAPMQTVLGHANNLLALIAENRGSKNKRPIIFVASCFGGLILAEVCKAK